MSKYLRALPALLCALGLAVAPPALAQGKDARKNAASEARYDTPAQVALLQQQATALAPQTKGVTDVYAIGIAGWTQDVFRHELSGALAATEKALPLAGTVRLVNSRETRNTIPLATRKNLAEAVRAVAGVMDKDEDVLLLFMTSHGQKSGFIPPAASGRFSAMLCSITA